jgi:general stress protein 26
MPETPRRQDAITTLADLIKDVPVAMLTTTGMGRLRSRPMVVQRVRFDGALWFLTARSAGKTGEIRDRQVVHVTFVSPGDNRYVWASGTATLVDDPGQVKAIWHDGYRPWFPKGPEDESISLIRVRVEEAGYWDAGAGQMALLAGFVEGTAFHDLQPGVGI